MSCGWTKTTPPADPWKPQPRALMLEEGGFLEIDDDCALMVLEEPA